MALISPRRMGKSGLIEHFFAQPEIAGRYITVYVDIYATSSTAELVATLSQAIFKTLAHESDTPWQRFVESLKSLRPAVTFDPLTGAPSLTVTTVSVTRPELTLGEIFQYLESAPRPIIIAID